MMKCKQIKNEVDKEERVWKKRFKWLFKCFSCESK